MSMVYGPMKHGFAIALAWPSERKPIQLVYAAILALKFRTGRLGLW